VVASLDKMPHSGLKKNTSCSVLLHDTYH
jgi:hypothetical protein